ncbi:hypothetical protein QOZ95_005288 [Paenibacillus brasilensis]|uniref:Resolvase/invertase-type recombinase catalytic domain-containing protein n=1 Tax=Paenibacillus brasilensis TaxID=128574 RepID=A0ABU0L719_9BACL|nr:hypothetical protein [Paenibacillus brasilensis]
MLFETAEWLVISSFQKVIKSIGVPLKIAYGRVSTKEQNIERQLLKFRELGIEERFVFVDKQSGKDFDRPRYQAMRLMLRVQ